MKFRTLCGVAALVACAAATEVSSQTPAAPTGDLRQQHQFDGFDTPSHYRIFVPRSYDPRKSYPMVVVLHGSGEDENRPFERSNLAEVADQRGYILLAPFGSPRGGFGNCYPVVVTKETAASLPSPDKAMQPRPAGPRPPLADVAVPPDDFVYQTATELQPDFKSAARSETETMDVLTLVRAQYNVDPARIYLMGNSMGGLGTAYLAVKYPEIWAAIAPSGGPVAAWSYPFERLRAHHIAALFVHGEFDEHSNPEWSRLLARTAKAQGVDAAFLMVPRGHHGGAWAEVLPQTFDFFAAHAKGPSK